MGLGRANSMAFILRGEIPTSTINFLCLVALNSASSSWLEVMIGPKRRTALSVALGDRIRKSVESILQYGELSTELHF